MAEHGSSKFGYFLAGMGLGAIVALLFAPRSGEETREYIRDKTEKGRDYVKDHKDEWRARAKEYSEVGKEFVGRQKESVESALEAGKRAYEEEKQRA